MELSQKHRGGILRNDSNESYKIKRESTPPGWAAAEWENEISWQNFVPSLVRSKVI